MADREPLLSVSEAARRLHVDVMTVRRLIYRGQLRAARIGKLWRIPADELERLATPVEIAAPGHRHGVGRAEDGRPVALPAIAAPSRRIFSRRPWEQDDDIAAPSAAARGRSATTKRAASQRN